VAVAVAAVVDALKEEVAAAGAPECKAVVGARECRVAAVVGRGCRAAGCPVAALRGCKAAERRGCKAA
jgi:hypothetical protein